jgi:predicted nucleotidyltransferase component of viral defense system
MSLSLAYLEGCSAETGYQVIPLEKVVRLGELAADINRHPLLSKALALKGGTALNLCFGPPGRLSIDLDYNYVAHVEREKMLADRPRIETAVSELAQRRGYGIQRSADAFAGRKIYLRYRSVLGPDERIEVDLNFLFRLPLAGTETRSLWQPGELDHAQVRVVSQSEVVTGKFLALLDRGAPRDAWDVAHLSDSSVKLLESRGFRERFVAMSAILQRPLPEYGRDRLMDLITDRVVAEQLLPMLSASHRADALLEQAWLRMEPLLSLETHEQEYIAAIQRGELRLDLLFPDDASEAIRLAEHPAIQWKIANVRAFRARARKTAAGTAPDSTTKEV